MYYITGMITDRPYSFLIERLKGAGLRPTRQRLALAKLLFEKGDYHLTAEHLHSQAIASNVRISLATVYNTLHQFTAAGLLREVMVEPGRSYFDTNVNEHHHFYFEDSGRLQDIPSDQARLADLPVPPEGSEVARVDIMIRLRESKA